MYPTKFPLNNNVWFVLIPIYFVLSSCFINVIFINLCTGVQHRLHIRCLCCLTVIWRVPLVEQELLTLPEDLSSFLVFSGVCVARSLVFCVVFCRSLFVLFLLAISLSVLLRFMASDYPLGIFKVFCPTYFVFVLDV